MADIAFPFIGGMHQALHIAPLATALAAHENVRVTAYVTPRDAEDLRDMFTQLAPDAAAAIGVIPLELPRWARFVRFLLGRDRGEKPLEILSWRKTLGRHDALVAAERTSTLLKRVPGRQPVMIHIPHGVGDRAKGFEPRIRLFDHVLVPGPLTRDRMLDEGLVTTRNCAVIGSLKLSVLTGPDAPAPISPFPDDRPIILYNPHFDTGLSSWPIARELIDRIVADGRFNLIVAPHARLFAQMSPAERQIWQSRPTAPNLFFDFASPRLGDMSYTRLADIYLGDVSSQIYEFLYRPRPCVFVDAHDAQWRDNPDYQMWTLGDVAQTPDEVMTALGNAAGRHAHYRTLQKAETEGRLGPVDAGVPVRAAETVLALLGRERGR